MIAMNVPEECRVQLELDLIRLTREARTPRTPDEAREFDWSRKRDLDKQIEHIRRAKQRIETGDYGICQNCHQAIDHERLKLLPTVEFCISCQRLLEWTTIGHRTNRLNITA